MTRWGRITASWAWATPTWEAIAIDPEGRTPPHARWFDLDRRSGPPRLSNWVLRLDDLEAAVAAVPQAGRILSFARDDLRWRMAVPVDGRLPYDGALPALIQWDGRAPTFPDTGSRLARLTVRHPDAGALRASIDALGGVRGVDIRDGDLALEATVDMPDGPRVLT